MFMTSQVWLSCAFRWWLADIVHCAGANDLSHCVACRWLHFSRLHHSLLDHSAVCFRCVPFSNFCAWDWSA